MSLADASSKREAWAAKTPPPTEEEEVENLYDPELLKPLQCVQDLSAKNETFYIRPLQSDDFSRGYVDLLKQLTSVGDVTETDFKGKEIPIIYLLSYLAISIIGCNYFTARFMELKSSNGTYYNTVIVDSNTNQIIGAATLIKERKFIHQCANVRNNLDTNFRM